MKKWVKDLNRPFNTEEVQMENRHVKGVKHHWSSGKGKLNPEEGVAAAAGMADTPTQRKLATPSAAKDAEKPKSHHCWGHRPERLKPNTHLLEDL